MKKLLTMIAAAATAFGLYAGDEQPTVEYGELTAATTTFSGLDDGDFDWAQQDDDGYYLWCSEVEVGSFSAKIVDEELSLETGTNTLYRAVSDLGAGGKVMKPVKVDDAELVAPRTELSFYQTVTFTGFEEAQTNLADGAKLALWMLTTEEEGTPGETNLYVTCGEILYAEDPEPSADPVVVRLDLAGSGIVDFDPEAAHEIQITAIKAVDWDPENDAVVLGFAIKIDNKEIRAAAEGPLFPTELPLTGPAIKLNNQKKLFPSFVKYDAPAANAVYGVGYKGIGKINDITVDASEDYLLGSYDLTLTPGENTELVSDPDNEALIVEGTPVTITATPTDPSYTINLTDEEVAAGWVVNEDGVAVLEKVMPAADTEIVGPSAAQNLVKFDFSGANVISVMAGDPLEDVPFDGSKYQVTPGTVVTVTIKAADGKLFSNGTNTKTFTLTPGNETIDLSLEDDSTTAGFAIIIADTATTNLYLTLDEAIAAYDNAGAVTLLDDATLAEPCKINKNVVIDLNEKTVTYTPATGWAFRFGDTDECEAEIANGEIVSSYYGVRVNQTTLTLDGVTINAAMRALQGTAASEITLDGCVLNSTGDAVAVLVQGGKLDLAGTQITAVGKCLDLSANVTATIDADSSVETTGNAPTIMAVFTDLTVGGTVKNTYAQWPESDAGRYAYAICGNGNDTDGLDLTIEAGAIISSANMTAIYFPCAGTLSIGAATITGTEGVYVKAGATAVIDGATINGTLTSDKVEAYEAKGDGFKNTGDAFVVDNCDYPAGVPTATITGGTFTSAAGVAVASYAKDGCVRVTGFISGGSFATDPTEYLKAGYATVKNGNLWDVGAAIIATFKVGDDIVKAETNITAFTAMPPAVDAPTGKTFEGWQPDVFAIAETTEFVAQFADQTFDITFTDAAAWTNVAKTVYNVMPVIPTDIPTVTGKSFKGWDTEVVAAVADATYTALYTANVYKITYTWTVKDEGPLAKALENTLPTEFTFGEGATIDATMVTVDPAVYSAIEFSATTIGTDVVADQTITITLTKKAEEPVQPITPGDDGEETVEIKANDAPTAEAAAKAAIVSPDAEIVDNATYQGYFKTTATEKSTGVFDVKVELDPEVVKAEVNTAVEQPITIASGNDGSEVTVAIKDVKPGLWYGYEVATGLGGDNTFVNDVASFVQAQKGASTLSIKGTKQMTPAAFFKIRVTPVKPAK